MIKNVYYGLLTLRLLLPDQPEPFESSLAKKLIENDGLKVIVANARFNRSFKSIHLFLIKSKTQKTNF